MCSLSTVWLPDYARIITFAVLPSEKRTHGSEFLPTMRWCLSNLHWRNLFVTMIPRKIWCLCVLKFCPNCLRRSKLLKWGYKVNCLLRWDTDCEDWCWNVSNEQLDNLSASRWNCERINLSYLRHRSVGLCSLNKNKCSTLHQPRTTDVAIPAWWNQFTRTCYRKEPPFNWRSLGRI